MKLTLPYPPSANRYWRTRLGGTPYVSKEAKEYRQAAATIASLAGARPLDGEVWVTLDVYRPARRGDLDNSIKVLLDSLKGLAYHDDAQVACLVAWRHDDKANPRVEVSIQNAQQAT